MKNFMYIKQTGEGCDYTIGCGEKLIETGPLTKEEIAEKLEYYGLLPSGVMATSVYMLTMTEDITPLYRELRDASEVVQREKYKQKEIKELEDRLNKLKGPKES